MHPTFERPLLSRVADIAIVAVFAVAACGGGAPAATSPVVPTQAGPSASSIGTPAATAEPSTAAVPTDSATEVPPTPEPTAAPSSTPAPAIGVGIQIGDQQVMTVVAAETWAGTSSVKPRAGKAFFTVSIRIDALLVTSFDSADFKLRDAAGKLYAWRTGRSPHLYDLANMTPGNNYVGWITYEVPKAVVGQLTLVYRPAFLGARKFEVPLF